MPDTQFQVVDGEVKEVSLVGAGANGEKEFLVMKSEDGDDVSTIEDLAERMDYASKEDIVEALNQLEKTQTEGGDQRVADLNELMEKYDGDEVDLSDLQKAAEEHGVRLNTEAVNEPSEDGDGDADSIEKSDLPDEWKTRIEKMEEEKQELEEAVQKERERRLRKEYLEKARTEYNAVHGSEEEKADLLRAIDEKLDEEEAETAKELLKTMGSQIKESRLFKEVGGRGSDDSTSDAYETYKKKAKERYQDGDFETIEQARKAVMEENPELYREYKRQAGV